MADHWLRRVHRVETGRARGFLPVRELRAGEHGEEASPPGSGSARLALPGNLGQLAHARGGHRVPNGFLTLRGPLDGNLASGGLWDGKGVLGLLLNVLKQLLALALLALKDGDVEARLGCLEPLQLPSVLLEDVPVNNALPLCVQTLNRP